MLGVHHTPPRVVDQVLDRALIHAEPLDEQTTVLDPAVGGGAFLLAMAERMPGTPFDIVARLHGVDVDPLAVATTRAPPGYRCGHTKISVATCRSGSLSAGSAYSSSKSPLVTLKYMRLGSPATAGACTLSEVVTRLG